MRKVAFSKYSEKRLEKLIKRSPDMARAVSSQIQDLRKNPTPTNSTKIVGYPSHRIRVGVYRVVYEFDDESLFVVILDKRDKVYKKMRDYYSAH